MSKEVIIRVEGLKKQYGKVKAVDGLEFEVMKGEIFSLLGPNGAGKTTTVEMIEGLRTPTSGSIEIFGVDILRSYASIRHRVGVLPQEFEPFDRLNAREAITYFASLFGKKLTGEGVDALVRTVGLEGRSRRIAMKLSGGEKRRLGIALALVGDPELLFLDEPTTGLDAQARRSLWRLLDRLRDAGKTIFLTTHYLDEAERLADNVLILHEGKEVARGSPSELVHRFGGGVSILLKGCTEISKIESLGFNIERVDGDIIIKLAEGSLVRDSVRLLDENHIEYEDFLTSEPSLEDAFLNLVGGRLVEGELRR